MYEHVQCYIIEAYIAGVWTTFLHKNVWKPGTITLIWYGMLWVWSGCGNLWTRLTQLLV